MAGLVPAIHADPLQRGIPFAAGDAAASDEPTLGWTAWMPGTSPGMTGGGAKAPTLAVTEGRDCRAGVKSDVP